MFDTHAHLEMLEESVSAVMARASEAGVDKILAVGSGSEANEFVVKAVDANKGVLFGAVGFDRDEAVAGQDDADRAAMIDELSALIAAHPSAVCAIGETGLDFHYLKETASEQVALFEDQLNLAAELKLPVIVHSRESDAETLSCLKAYSAKCAGRVPGVIHCFTGGSEFAKRAVELGFMISFSGILTFRNADALRQVARELPEEVLLVETDSPFLAPIPLRGKKNEPAFVEHTVKLLAELRGVSVEDMVRITDRNACRLFGCN
jgi:TatD DNase family protein